VVRGGVARCGVLRGIVATRVIPTTGIPDTSCNLLINCIIAGLPVEYTTANLYVCLSPTSSNACVCDSICVTRESKRHKWNVTIMSLIRLSNWVRGERERKVSVA
jgi:hypothetical protein